MTDVTQLQAGVSSSMGMSGDHMNQVDRDEWAGSLSDALLDYAIEVNAERQAESAATLSSVTAMLNRLRVEKRRRGGIAP